MLRKNGTPWQGCSSFSEEKRHIPQVQKNYLQIKFRQKYIKHFSHNEASPPKSRKAVTLNCSLTMGLNGPISFHKAPCWRSYFRRGLLFLSSDWKCCSHVKQTYKHGHRDLLKVADLPVVYQLMPSRKRRTVQPVGAHGGAELTIAVDEAGDLDYWHKVGNIRVIKIHGAIRAPWHFAPGHKYLRLNI